MTRTDYSAWHLRWSPQTKFTVRAFICLILNILTFGLFWHWGKREFSERKKNLFNILFVYISLGFGGTMIAAFSDIAQVVRWRILASKKFTLEEVEMILSLTGLQSFARLMGVKSSPRLLVIGAFGVFLLIVTQVFVGLMGITYDIQSVVTTRLAHGLVNITDMRSFYPDSHGDRNLEPEYSIQQSTAHLYGDIATHFLLGAFGRSDYGEYASLIVNPDVNSTQWAYKFQESYYSNKLGLAGSVVRVTNRSVRVTPQCKYHPIIEGQYSGVESTNATISIGGRNLTINWMQNFAVGATTYVNPSGFSSDIEPCGPRCSRIYIFQPADKAWNLPAGTGSFFDCTITISQVQNANHLQPFHSMSDRAAVVAAGSIGVSGYSNDNSYPFVQYRNWSAWGQRLGNSTVLAELLVGKYTVGVIAAYDIYGPSVEVMGLRSTIGSRLVVEWSFIIMILGCLFVLQLMGWMLGFQNIRFVPWKDNSYSSTTRLLGPLLEHFENSGLPSAGQEPSAGEETLAGQETSASPGSWRNFNKLVRYRVSRGQRGEENIYSLEIVGPARVP